MRNQDQRNNQYRGPQKPPEEMAIIYEQLAKPAEAPRTELKKRRTRDTENTDTNSRVRTRTQCPTDPRTIV